MAVTKGRIRQSLAHWCLEAADESWSLEQTCRLASELGCPAVELVDQAQWDTVKRHGLVCASTLIGMPGLPFVRGYNNPRYHDELIARSQRTIDACRAAGVPNVLAFVGYMWHDAEDPHSGEIPRDEAADNCVAGLKAIARYAEQHGVNLCVEHLNTRVDDHPMKGHPGYQGDDLDFVASIIRRVGSPRVKLLFDVYHVQIMHGDVLRRLEENADILGHVHVAGNPGRGEPNDSQEINYPAVMHKLVQLGYPGYVGQEFIPTGDPAESVRAAVELCDV